MQLRVSHSRTVPRLFIYNWMLRMTDYSARYPSSLPVKWNQRIDAPLHCITYICEININSQPHIDCWTLIVDLFLRHHRCTGTSGIIVYPPAAHRPHCHNQRREDGRLIFSFTAASSLSSPFQTYFNRFGSNSCNHDGCDRWY